MTIVLSIHSFRRGTGKSTIIANLAALSASEGKRVGVIDLGFHSPSDHILFNLKERDIEHTLNDFVWGDCAIEQAAYDVTGNLGSDITGKVILVPSSASTLDIAKIARDGYDPTVLEDGIPALIAEYNLDVLLIDTHAGVNEETLLATAISDLIAVLLRVDKQDFQGTAVLVDLARKLGVERVRLVLNEVPKSYNGDDIRSEVEQSYGAEVVALLPHSDELLALSSTGIFSLHFPEHPITQEFKALKENLLA